MTNDKKFENTIPVLPVSDLAKSLSFYTEKLGFAEDWRTERVASVSRDGCHIMMWQDMDSKPPVWVWIGVVDDVLFDEWRAKGVTVAQEPTNQPWAYEMKFNDPDGNVLWLGTGPKS